MDAVEASALPHDLVFVDLETTGGNAAFHRITEVGIVRIENGAPIEEWSSLVNPECRIPAAIESFTGITNEMVAAAPRFADIARLVREKLGWRASPEPVFVAHNARFDYSFLRAEFRRAELPFSAKVLCTVRLSRRLFPQHVRHNLDALMERHGLACSARHRALGDARVLKDFWFKLRDEVPEARLAAGARAVLGANRLPAQLPEGIADELPEGAGVYRFFGSDDALLYIGKSTCLRTRVLGHFAAAQTDTKEHKLGTLVRRIDWHETAGELGALLLEAHWIKVQKPLYNRRLKESGESFTLRIDAASGAAEIGSIAELDPDELAECRGLFHSRKDARKALLDIARARELCAKILGLEASEGSCFAYQVGKCKGACVGREPLVLHGVRTHLALSSLKLRAWPFPGRAALRERGPCGLDELHVVDQWRYLGTARGEEELAALAGQPAPAAFDPHVYRILTRHFTRHPKLEWHDLSAATLSS